MDISYKGLKFISMTIFVKCLFGVVSYSFGLFLGNTSNHICKTKYRQIFGLLLTYGTPLLNKGFLFILLLFSILPTVLITLLINVKEAYWLHHFLQQQDLDAFQ